MLLCAESPDFCALSYFPSYELFFPGGAVETREPASHGHLSYVFVPHSYFSFSLVTPLIQLSILSFQNAQTPCYVFLSTSPTLLLLRVPPDYSGSATFLPPEFRIELLTLFYKHLTPALDLTQPHISRLLRPSVEPCVILHHDDRQCLTVHQTTERTPGTS